jgi:hypothetical protein
MGMGDSFAFGGPNARTVTTLRFRSSESFALMDRFRLGFPRDARPANRAAFP